MITFSKLKESALDSLKRILKVQQFGVKTAKECAPFGDDGSPIADMTAIFADTSNNAEAVIIGYINKNQIAGPGEKRIFSLDSTGNLSTDIHLKSDGTLEIGGNIHTAVRYAPLNAGLQQQVLALNAELAKVAVVLNTLVPNSYVLTPVSVNIVQSNADKIKLG